MGRGRKNRQTHREKKLAFLRSALCTDRPQYPVGSIGTCAVSESLVMRCMLSGILIQLSDKSIKKISPDGGWRRREAGLRGRVAGWMAGLEGRN